MREKILGIYFMTYVVQQRKIFVTDEEGHEKVRDP